MSRLGDMMRLGAKKKPQAVSYYFDASAGATCAIGAAVDGALGVSSGFISRHLEEHGEFNTIVSETADYEFPELDQRFASTEAELVYSKVFGVPPPKEFFSGFPYSSLKTIIVTMNDILHHTREQIASLVDALLDSRFVAPKLTGAQVVEGILAEQPPLPAKSLSQAEEVIILKEIVSNG